MPGSDHFSTHVSGQNGSAVLVVAGALDVATAPRFRAAFEEAVATSVRVIVDRGQLSFIDSSGLREVVLGSMAVEGRGSVTLCNVNKAPMAVLKVTGLTDYLTIHAVASPNGG